MNENTHGNKRERNGEALELLDDVVKDGIILKMAQKADVKTDRVLKVLNVAV